MDKEERVIIDGRKVTFIAELATELFDNPCTAIVGLIKAAELLDLNFRQDCDKRSFLEMMKYIYDSIEEAPNAPSIDIPQGTA